MKILELDIHNVRGIPDLSLKPDGKNLVIWGLNGSGKSAVVDAIDFLLTGNISRLIGEGTGEISLPRHGPHIDHKPEEAVVRALISLDAVAEKVENVIKSIKTIKPIIFFFIYIPRFHIYINL